MDNFDLRKYLSEGKIYLQEVVVDRTKFKFIEGNDYNYDEEMKEAGPNAEIFSLVDPVGVIVDPNFNTYHSATQEIMDLADEQGHEWYDVEDYFDMVEGHEDTFKEYPKGTEVPEEVMREEAMQYGTDYGQFYGGDRDDYYQQEGKLNENQDDSYYIDEIKRDLEELDDKEANEYLEELSKSILKLKR
jgi:hypothetical protein